MKKKVSQFDDDVNTLMSAGFKSIAKQYSEMASTLKVIHCWAIFLNGQDLKPRSVLNLTYKVLNRFTFKGD